MTPAAAAELIPLVADPEGVLRITGTRVTLDAVVAAYGGGSTPEEIAQRDPSLQLADVYAVLTYYLRHKEQVDTYIRRRQEPTTAATYESRKSLFPARVAGFDPEPVSSRIAEVAGERSELLARKHGGQTLSLDQQKRLEALTLRLKELLPPVSFDDLEVLLKMTDEMKQIRQRAEERQRRLGWGRMDERPL